METKNMSIKNWAVDDRPREKLIKNGSQSLSNAELIAILLGSGTRNDSAVSVAQKLLLQANNNLNELASYSYTQLCKIRGVGTAKAVRLMAALELGRRRNAEVVMDRKKVASSADAATIFTALLSDLPYEEFWILLLNRANYIIDKIKISQGGISGTVTDVRIILNAALERKASAIIVCHNHPSGNLIPSDADKEFTKKLFEACKIMDISLLDHIIVGQSGYFSFADEEILK